MVLVTSTHLFSCATVSSRELCDATHQWKLTSRKHHLGESVWNQENKFTGWCDVPLSAKGVEEAAEGGQILNDAGFKFDVAYTSYLKRAINTMNHTLEVRCLRAKL